MISFGESILHSKNAEEGAVQLIRNIKDGIMKREIPSCSYSNYNEELEYNDFASYCKFLQSINGKTLFKQLEEDSFK